MKAEQIAKQVLTDEYSDYKKNSWHYERQYIMIFKAINMYEFFNSADKAPTERIKPFILCEESVVSKWKREDKDDLIQYVTNLLYVAHGFGEASEGVNTPKFDEWIEEQTKLLELYFKQGH